MRFHPVDLTDCAAQVVAGLVQRLMAHRVVNGECWLWDGAFNEKGYGIMCLKIPGQPKRCERVHRVSYAAFRGPVTGELCVLHECDNRTCFNPSHLFLGTHQDNTDDMHTKGRWVKPAPRRGENATRAKLREADVRAMVARTIAGASRAELAREYMVSISTVSKAVLGGNWKHVTANCGVQKSPRGVRRADH